MWLMTKIVKLYVNHATHPISIARVILLALDNNRDVEIISMNSDAVARATEALRLCKCSGKIEPTSSEKVKIYLDNTAI